MTGVCAVCGNDDGSVVGRTGGCAGTTGVWGNDGVCAGTAGAGRMGGWIYDTGRSAALNQGGPGLAACCLMTPSVIF